ncbi:hypothetical protein [Nocardioides rubriscoriae]|uniref:hypothetical protein n=1 Tax=Nocardioides rubriscoriae TaxID=642762 RepID=UPI0011DF90FA|nr:hypothetical protein [Nocardioides rubriscoriae]
MSTAEHRATARDYLDKARQFLLVAESALNGADNAAASNAVHAGISAKDAICTVLSGRTAKTDDHRQAVTELRTALGHRPEAAGAAKALRSLLSTKTPAQYSSKLVDHTKASKAVSDAELLVELAARVLAGS